MKRLQIRIASLVRPVFIGVLLGLSVFSLYHIGNFQSFKRLELGKSILNNSNVNSTLVLHTSRELLTNNSVENLTTVSAMPRFPTRVLTTSRSLTTVFTASKKPLINNSAENLASFVDYVVPNVVHFIWYAENDKRVFTFINYVSIYSAYKIQKPKVIKLHCNVLPSGDWWQKLWRKVPITLQHRQINYYVYGQKIGPIYHVADVAKIEIMIEEGGMYFDMDVIVVNNLDPLRVYDATLGKEKPPKYIAGIMIGKPNATFFRLMHEAYRGDYRANDWDYNCARVPYSIHQKHPELLHVEKYKLTTPDYIDAGNLWDRVIDWHGLYVIHLMSHLRNEEVSPESIKRINTTFGEVMRFIYYDSWEIIDDKQTTGNSSSLQTTQGSVGLTVKKSS